MKRDKELCREILLKLEQAGELVCMEQKLISDVTQYHYDILGDAGYIKLMYYLYTDTHPPAYSLTNLGKEMCDIIRNPIMWKTANKFLTLEFGADGYNWEQIIDLLKENAEKLKNI